MKVGFIGLGQMGHGMASNLLQATHDITVYNRSPRKADDLIARGALNAVSIAEVCGSDAVMTMLSYDKAVEHLALGQDGIVASLAKSAIHISSSTISVGLAEQLTAAHAKAGQHFVSTLVFGRPDAAAAGNIYSFGWRRSTVKRIFRPVAAGSEPTRKSLNAGAVGFASLNWSTRAAFR